MNTQGSSKYRPRGRVTVSAKKKTEEIKTLANSQGQPLFQHLAVQRVLAQEYISTLSFYNRADRNTISVACVLFGQFHDLGKTSRSWQKKVIHGIETVRVKSNHEVLGASLLSRLKSGAAPILKSLKNNYSDDYDLGRVIAIKNILFHHSRGESCAEIVQTAVDHAGNMKAILTGEGKFKHDYNSNEIASILELDLGCSFDSSLTEDVFAPRIFDNGKFQSTEETEGRHASYVNSNSLLLSSRHISIIIDRFVSSLSRERLNEAFDQMTSAGATGLLKSLTESVRQLRSFEFEVSPQTLSTSQGKAQLEAAENFSQDFGVLGANANFGKTLTTLLIADKLNVSRVIYVCPRLMVMKSIKNDMISNKPKTYSYGLKDGARIGWLSSVGVLDDENNGEYVAEVQGSELVAIGSDEQKQSFKNCDVIIMTTDRFCNVMNELGNTTGAHEIFRDALVVMDEYHEQVETAYQIHEIYAGLKSLSVLRAKVVLISATTNLELLRGVGIQAEFKETLVDPTNFNRYLFEIELAKEIGSRLASGRREARIYTKTDDAKADALADILSGKNTRLATSDVEPDAKALMFSSLKDEFGTDSHVSDILLRTGPITKSSLPFSFDNAKIMLMPVEDMIQIACGRVNRKKNENLVSQVSFCVGNEDSSLEWLKSYQLEKKGDRDKSFNIKDKQNNQHGALIAKSGGTSDLIKDSLLFVSHLLDSQTSATLTTKEIFRKYDQFILGDRPFYRSFIQNKLTEGLEYISKYQDLLRTRTSDLDASGDVQPGKEFGWRGGSKVSRCLKVRIEKVDGKWTLFEDGYTNLFTESIDFGERKSESKLWESETADSSRRLHIERGEKWVSFKNPKTPLIFSLSQDDANVIKDTKLRMHYDTTAAECDLVVYVTVINEGRTFDIGRMPISAVKSKISAWQ